MASIVDLLLAADSSKLADLPTTTIEVSRLSKLLGATFEFEVHALTLQEFDELAERKGDFRVHAILMALSEPIFSNVELCKKFTPKERKTPLTADELLKKLLLPGEIVNAYNEVSKLSGFTDDAIEVVEKN